MNLTEDQQNDVKTLIRAYLTETGLQDIADRVKARNTPIEKVVSDGAKPRRGRKPGGELLQTEAAIKQRERYKAKKTESAGVDPQTVKPVPAPASSPVPMIQGERVQTVPTPERDPVMEVMIRGT